MGCEYTTPEGVQDMDGLENPTKRPPQSIRSNRSIVKSEVKATITYKLRQMPLWGKSEDYNNKDFEKFQWPNEEDLANLRDPSVRLRELRMKSALHDRNTGICSVKVVLTNGESSGEINVLGDESNMQGCLKMPDDPKSVRGAWAYADEKGVYNIFLMGKDGRDLSRYDPKNYG